MKQEHHQTFSSAGEGPLYAHGLQLSLGEGSAWTRTRQNNRENHLMLACDALPVFRRDQINGRLL